MRILVRAALSAFFFELVLSVAVAVEPMDIGSRLEPFFDGALIDRAENVRLEMHHPEDRGVVLKFDSAWEGPFCGYCTVIKDGAAFRLYYRGKPAANADGSSDETTCMAESTDGIHWTKPNLGLYETQGSKQNNVVLANASPVTHNFSPFLDQRPGVPADERYKGLGGVGSKVGLVPYASADGIRWRPLREEGVLKKGPFDSQNVSFWSSAEQCYVCYFRVFRDGIRRISRSTSADFLSWTEPQLMEYHTAGSPSPIEHLYTNQTHPYFRAPHIYLSFAARFMPHRQVLTDAEAKAINVHPKYFHDCSDAIFMTTRGGAIYERTFLEGFIRPGVGPQNWVSRSNYPALNAVQTGPAEMSVYLNQDYGQPTAHLRRYSLRLDGVASVTAPYAGGRLVTKPIRFAGEKLVLNLATSAAGGVRVEIQDEHGQPIPGYSLADASELIGNEIEKTVAWKSGSDVSPLAGKTVRLCFAMKDADIYSFRFTAPQ